VTQEASPRTTAGSSVFSLFVSCALLAGVLIPVSIAISAGSVGRLRQEAIASAVIAAMVCWLAGALALTATYLGNQMKQAVPGLLAGMFFRMGLPLVAILALPNFGGPLAPRGSAVTILGVYLVALFVETLLSLRMVPSHSAITKTA
jgi:hypothetical protein